MSDYKPGTVAVVTFCSEAMLKPDTQRATRWRYGWLVAYENGDWELTHDRYVTDVRPLVVLDAAECADPLILATACAAGAGALRETNPGRKLLDADALTWIADQIEAQTKPPKPPEPTGLGAVVEDADGVRWLRTTTPERDMENLDKPWADGPVRRNWQIVDAVRVLSPGVLP